MGTTPRRSTPTADGVLVTDPCDGILQVLDVKALSRKATAKLGGTPAGIVAYRGRV